MVKGKKSALLVGCDYNGTQFQSHGCVNDVNIIEKVLHSFDFDPVNITKLVENNTKSQPTAVNIENELNHMIKEAGDGGVLFFYFSGTMKVNDQGNNIPAILCCDLEGLPATKFDPTPNHLPKFTSFTLVLESSYSGNFIHPVDPDHNVILFSACRADETAKRDPNGYGEFTDAIRAVLDDYPPPATQITNEELLKEVSALLKRCDQHPCLRCNDKNRNVPFLGYLGTDKE